MTTYPVFVAMVRAACDADAGCVECRYPTCLEFSGFKSVKPHGAPAQVRAALAVAAAIGWKLTPRKRTPAMIKATAAACGGIHHDAVVWRDTWDAAPDIADDTA